MSGWVKQTDRPHCPTPPHILILPRLCARVAPVRQMGRQAGRTSNAQASRGRAYERPSPHLHRVVVIEGEQVLQLQGAEASIARGGRRAGGTTNAGRGRGRGRGGHWRGVAICLYQKDTHTALRRGDENHGLRSWEESRTEVAKVQKSGGDLESTPGGRKSSRRHQRGASRCVACPPALMSTRRCPLRCAAPYGRAGELNGRWSASTTIEGGR